MDRDLQTKNDEIKLIKRKNEELMIIKEKLEKTYMEDITALRTTLENEREAAKKGLYELSEMNKAQERKFSESINEIETYMSQILSGKKPKSSTNLNIAQMMLNKLAEEKQGNLEPDRKESPIENPVPQTEKITKTKKQPAAPIKAYSQKRLPIEKKSELKKQ